MTLWTISIMQRVILLNVITSTQEKAELSNNLFSRAVAEPAIWERTKPKLKIILHQILDITASFFCVGFVSTCLPMLWDSTQDIGKVILMHTSYSRWQSTGRVNAIAHFDNYSPSSPVALSSTKWCPSSRNIFTSNLWKVVHNKTW